MPDLPQPSLPARPPASRPGLAAPSGLPVDDVVGAVVGAVRATAPLVHVICAPVSQPLVAEGLLAAGGRPMMTETLTEAPAMTTLADALLVNLGALSVEAARSVEPVVAAARAAGHPWVLDPTAVGVAPVRTPLAVRLLDASPAVVRGNASEVLVLGLGGRAAPGGRGPDSSHSTSDAATAAGLVARRTGGAVSVSGATDLVLDARRRVEVRGGSDLLPRVVATGCLLGALTAACCTVAAPVDAAVAACTWLARASERAAERCSGPGSFRVLLVDALDEVLR